MSGALEDTIDSRGICEPGPELLQAGDQCIERGADVAGVRRAHFAPDVRRARRQSRCCPSGLALRVAGRSESLPRQRPPSTRSPSAAADGSETPSLDRGLLHPSSWAVRRGFRTNPSQSIDSRRGARPVWRENPRPPAEQVGTREREAALFGAADRVTADERCPHAGQRARRVHDVALGAADVGDQTAVTDSRGAPREAAGRSARPARRG